MVRKLRLIVTYKCPRNCAGCCNKTWSEPVPTITVEEASAYDEIFITGGEPMLFPEKLVDLIAKIKRPDNKVILYTAECGDPPTSEWKKGHDSLISMLDFVDGLTLTLHEEEDIPAFMVFNATLGIYDLPDRSLRLNQFASAPLPSWLNLSAWKIVVRDKVWLDNAPVPEGEDLRKLEEVW